MNCRKIRSRFSMRLDGDLNYVEQREFEEHLERCAACNAEFRSMERTVKLVRDLPEVEVSETFVQDVVRRARQASPSPAPGVVEKLRIYWREAHWIGTPQMAAAAVVFGLLVGVGAGMLAFRGEGPTATVAQQVSEPSAPASTAAPAIDATRAADETPVPGSLGDLVDEMKHRLEGEGSGATDSVETTPPDWGPTRDQLGVGQQVGAAPGAQRNGSSGGRVYIVF